MNKLTKDLIYEIAVQGRDKIQWNKALESFGSKETRTPWKTWINYICKQRKYSGLYDIVGYYKDPEKDRAGWELMIDQENYSDPITYVRATIRIHLGTPDYIYIRFMFKGPREGPKITFQGENWMSELIPMCNHLASKGYEFYYYRRNMVSMSRTTIQKHEDFDSILAKFEPEVLQDIARSIKDSGLDFYPEPVLQLLKTCQGLGINYQP